MPKPFDPEAPVCCKSCGWKGKGKDCDPQPREVVKCPYCGTAVERVEPEDNKINWREFL